MKNITSKMFEILARPSWRATKRAPGGFRAHFRSLNSRVEGKLVHYNIVVVIVMSISYFRHSYSVETLVGKIRFILIFFFCDTSSFSEPDFEQRIKYRLETRTNRNQS